jgi:hypothetical protein
MHAWSVPVQLASTREEAALEKIMAGDSTCGSTSYNLHLLKSRRGTNQWMRRLHVLSVLQMSARSGRDNFDPATIAQSSATCCMLYAVCIMLMRIAVWCQDRGITQPIGAAPGNIKLHSVVVHKKSTIVVLADLSFSLLCITWRTRDIHSHNPTTGLY